MLYLNLQSKDTINFRFDYVCLPIVNPRYKREKIQGPAKCRPGALTRSDLCMSSSGKKDYNFIGYYITFTGYINQS